MQAQVLGRAYEPYQYFQMRRRELAKQAATNMGKLPYHQWFRHDYYCNPYPILETDEAVSERFTDIFVNTVTLTKAGQLALTPMMENDARFARRFTEATEETNWRGALTRDAIAAARAPLVAYFKDGEPLGCRMFGERDYLPGKCLVKYSKQLFVSDMLQHGRFRISPASEYSKGSHIKAVKDFETARPYKVKALSDVLKGRNAIDYRGIRMEIENGVLPIELMMDNYFLFSTCTELDRRMPTDFEADAALIIKDKKTFLHRFRAALLEKQPGCRFLEGDVYYYDPYNDVPKDRNQELWKHFSYAYQREHRCILRTRNLGAEPLEPFFVELGPLDDIAEAVYAPT